MAGISRACVRHLKSVLPVHPCCETGDLPWPLSMFVISEMIREVSLPPAEEPRMIPGARDAFTHIAEAYRVSSK